MQCHSIHLALLPNCLLLVTICLDKICSRNIHNPIVLSKRQPPLQDVRGRLIRMIFCKGILFSPFGCFSAIEITKFICQSIWYLNFKSIFSPSPGLPILIVLLYSFIELDKVKTILLSNLYYCGLEFCYILGTNLRFICIMT